MLFSRTTWLQRAISLCSSACAACGERWSLANGVTPVSAQALTIAGSSSTPSSTALSLSITPFGVPPGTNKACQ